jgi:sn-glycerol 3-phosphate transport system substrate-binding protein
MRARLLAPVFLAAALVAASCGGGSDDGGGGGGGGQGAGPVDPADLPECPLDALEAAEGPVEVVVWHALSAKAEEALEKIASDYNASQDKVKVDIQVQGKAFDEVLRKYQSAIAGDRLPAIAYLESTSLRTLVDTGTVLPAQACMEETGPDLDALEPAVRSYYTVDGVYWPGYVNVTSPVLYYNQVHFRRAGLDPNDPPETLEELRATAEKLKESGIDKPLALILNSFFTETWLNGAGIEVVDQGNGRDDIAGEAVFDTEEAVELVTFLKEMTDDGLLEPVSATAGQINQYLALANQTSSMTIETSTAATTMKAFLKGDLDPAAAGVDIDPEALDTAELVPAAGPFPGISEPGKVQLGGAGFFIANTTAPEVQAASWDFLRFMNEPAQAELWHLLGSYLPSLKSVADQPAVQDFWETELDGRMLNVAVEQLGEVDAFQPGPLIGPYPEYSQAIKDMLDAVLFKGDDPAEAVARAEQTVTEALEQYKG